MKIRAFSFGLFAAMLLAVLPGLALVDSSYAHEYSEDMSEGEVDQEITRLIDGLDTLGDDEHTYNELEQLFQLRAKRSGGRTRPGAGRQEGVWEGSLEAVALTSMDALQGARHSVYRYTLKTAKGDFRLFSPRLNWSTLHAAARVRVTGLLAGGNILVRDISVLEAREKPFHKKDHAPRRKPQSKAAPQVPAVQYDAQGAGGGGTAQGAATSEASAPQEMRALVIAANYTDNTAQSPAQTTINNTYFGTSNSLAGYWNEASYGRMTLTGNTAGWYTLDITSAQASSLCNEMSSTSLVSLVQQASTKAEQGGADLSLYDTIVLIMPSPSPTCPFAGVATGGTIQTASGPIYYPVNINIANYLNAWPVHLSSHEAGHTLGLPHARAADFAADVAGDIGAQITDWGYYTEYGDQYDTMGGIVARKPGHYQAAFKAALSWLQPADIASFDASPLTVTVEPMSSLLTGQKAMKIFRGARYATELFFGFQRSYIAREYVWIETRAALGYDSTLDARAHGRVLVHLERSGGLSSGKYLLDMHPETGPDSGNVSNFDFYDAGLNVGESFHDLYGKITIQYVSLDPATGNAVVTVTADPDRETDTDEDGLSDATEAVYGTDPANPDTDGDGVLDLFEVCHDGDCSTYQPYPSGGDMNALSADTDGDSISDGEEKSRFTNPLSNVDTDGDGMNDDWEQIRGTNKAVDDAAADTDGDGVVNIVEYDRGTSPTSATSVPQLRTLYVNSAASGFEDGSLQFPYRLGSTAVTNALSGDTVQLMPGRHRGFAVNKPLRVLGQPDGSATVFTPMTLQDMRWGEIQSIQSESGFIVQNSRDITLSYSNVTAWVPTTHYEPQLQATVFSATFLVKANSRLTIRNSLVIGMGDSWGMRIWDSTVNLVNDTVVGYPTAVERTTAPSQVTVHNSIFYNNTTDLAGNVDPSAVSYSLFGTGQFAGSGGNVSVDPRFVDYEAQNLRLRADSPVLDAGDPADSDGNEPAPSCGIEMGAYGNTAGATATPDANGNGVGDACEADLAAAVSASPGAVTTVGEQIRYLVTVTNHGPRQADGVVASMAIPPGSYRWGAVSQGTCPNLGSSCTLGTLAPNASASIEVFAYVGNGDSAAPKTLSASVASSITDPNQSNNTASASVDTSGVAPSCLTPGWPASGISGYVRTASGVGIGGVSLLLQGASGCRNLLGTMTGSSAGYYSTPFNSLTTGMNYTLTPNMSGCSFSPVVASFTKGSTAVTKNFTGACAP